ncbi:MAG TPA: hypothetical protein VF546_06455 [Pyrinomonadaceae bacterium]|jgi:hypothetical protein
MRQLLPLVCAVCLLALAGCTSNTTTTTTQPAAPGAPPATGTGQPAAPGQTPAPGQPVPAAPGAPQAAGAPTGPNATGAPAASADACGLLTSAEIKEVQGEEVKDTKASQRSDASLAIAQCFYTTPTFTKSVSLEVTRPVPGGRESPREFWREHFTAAANEGREREHERERERERGKDKDKEKERERERERERRGGEEEEEEGAPPQRVTGIGDEAYLINSRVGGALYVLKGDKFLRVGIGSGDNDATRQKKLRALAQKALARL